MSGYVYKEYPKSLFKIDADGHRRERIFNSAEEVEEGWTDLAGMPVPVVEKAAPELPRLYRELQADNAALRDSVKFLQDENSRLEREIERLTGVELAPDGAAPPPEPPKPKRKRKA